MTAQPIEIVASVLPADFARLGDECAALGEAGIDRIQFDVMDGRFVPNLTFGPDVIAACRPHTDVTFEAHLMVEQPEAMAARYVEAGCALVIVHAEATTHLHKTLAAIRELGADAAVALNPSTPPGEITHVLDLVSMVLVMTVNPGFGGQRYIDTMAPKIEAVRAAANEAATSTNEPGAAHIDVEVDGGISAATVAHAAAAGANVLVSGSAIYSHPDGLRAAISELRELAEAARSA